MRRDGQCRGLVDRNEEAKYTGQEMRKEKGGVVKYSTDTGNQGVSALLKIMDPNGKYSTSVILPENLQVFINFAMESMDTENVPTHSGDDTGDPRCLKEVDA